MKLKPLAVPLLAAAVALSVCASAAGAGKPVPPPPTVTVDVAVDWSVDRYQTTGLNYGLAGFKAFAPSIAGNAQYNSQLQVMKPGLFRYHSWEMLWESATTETGWLINASGPNPVWDAAKINSALSGLQANTVKMLNIPGYTQGFKTYDVKSSTGQVVATLLDPSEYDRFAAWCAELVRIVNVTYGHNVRYWEITNEWDDNYYVKLRNAGLPDRMNELADVYNRAAKAMKAVDPTILTGGPAFARGDLYDSVRTFVNGTIQESNPTTLDFFTYHFYASGNQNETDAQIYNRVHYPGDPNVGTLQKHTKDIRAILDELSPSRHIPLYLDEYNISWTWTNNDPRMQNHKGGVFDALAMVYAADNGADGTTAWNEMDGVYGKMDGSYNLRPSARVFHMFNNYLNGTRAASSTGDPSTVVAYAVKTDSTKSIALINRSASMAKLNLQFNGWVPGGTTFNQYRVSAAGYAESTVSWSDLTGGSYTLPDHSVTVLTIADSGSGTPDTQPPTAPANLTAAADGSSRINLSWSASTDDRAVAGYRIYRNGVETGTSAGPAYTDSGLAPSTAYSYTVRAYDTSGNLSGASNTAVATTAAPDPNLVTNGGFETGAWSPWSALGASIVSGNAHSGTYAAQITGSGTGVWQTITGLAPSTTYRLKVFGKASSNREQAVLYAKYYGGSEQQATLAGTVYAESAITFTTGPSNTSVELGVWKSAGRGSVYADDFELIQLP